MSDSRLPNRKSSAPGTRAMQASGDGYWELNLVDGSAWFSDWFCQRLQWRDPVRRAVFRDLRPIMSPEAWNALLRKMRSHLEECAPLDTEFEVQLAPGQIQWWHLRGSAQRSRGGHPTHVAGCVRYITATRGREQEP